MTKAKKKIVKKKKKKADPIKKIRDNIRRIWNFYCPKRHQALADAKIGVAYQCKICGDLFSKKEVEVDHIVRVGVFKFESIGDWVHRMMHNEQRVLCKTCHKIKTSEEK